MYPPAVTLLNVMVSISGTTIIGALIEVRERAARRAELDGGTPGGYYPVWMPGISRALIAMLLALLLVQPARTQSPGPLPPLTPAAAEIRAKVQALPIGGKITLNMSIGTQYCGNLHSVEGETFSLREVDLKTVVTVRYEDVERVRKDYGRPGFSGRRVHPRTNHIAMIAILGGLLAVVFAVVLSDKS